MADQGSQNIESSLNEKRTFPPSAEFRREARHSDPVAFKKLLDDAERDPESYWAEAASELTWARKWTKTLDWQPPYAKWFVGGQINAAVNCVDRHLETRGEKLAIIWEGEDGSVIRWTYRDLHERVCKMANALEALGLVAGDTAAIYLPLVPEAVVAMLACARVGITHSVIFGGFSAPAIRDRVNDAQCKVIFTADVGFRKGQSLNLRAIVETALKEVTSVKHVIALQRAHVDALPPKWHDWRTMCRMQAETHTPKAFDAEHPLFLLYTSGTTGKPKGIVHSTGGYLTQAARTFQWVFDLKEDDVYWCTADIGWITGHSYLVYGPLANGSTCVLFEGALNHPDPGRVWEMVQNHKVTILYTAPTAIRACMRSGDDYPAKYDLTSLRLLGSVGEPINPEAWMWYRKQIGGDRCPIVDTWWQTETGAILISPIPGVTDAAPGSATRPFPGIVADIVDEAGNSCGPNQGGYLVIKKPWPSMLRGLHQDPDRYQQNYWSRFPGMYFTGDGASRDENGFFWIKGRVDDVINVSGHRLGTMEIESALVSHPAVAEAAVVGKADEIKGQAIVAFVTPRESMKITDTLGLAKLLKEHVVREIGALARPDEIRFTKTLPKTRSGKIMRRFLKDLADGKAVTGDTTTLENPGLVDPIE